MKRLKLTLCLFCVIFFNISVITAENATCWENGLFTNYGLRIYKKTCTIGGKNYISFCTRFKADAPHGYTCESTGWKKDGNENKAISYAIGYIIKSYGVSRFNGNYTLAESAINKFLLDITKNNVYKHPISIYNKSTLQKYNSTIANAKKIYINRQNGKDYNEDGKRKVQITDKTISGNQLTVKILCYNQYGAKSCVAPSVTATIGNSNYSMRKTSDEAGRATFTLDIGKILSTYEQNKVTINIKASQTLNYCKAYNYKCGGYQSMTPNKCTSLSEKIETPDSITITPPPPKESKDTCQNLVNEAKNKYKDTNQGKYYETLLSIYKANKESTIEIDGKVKKCSDCKEKTFGEILNLSNPSCNEITNHNQSLTCDGINTNLNFLQSDASGNPYYCSSKFSLDTSETIGSKYEFNYGDLLYRSTDGNIASGTLSYSCQIPSKSNVSVSIIPKLPKIQLTVNNQAAIFNSYLNDSLCVSNTCSAVSLTSSKSTVNGNVQYKYPDYFNYKLSKGGLFNIVDSDSDDCKIKGKCIDYGFGFSTDTSWENGKSTLKIYESSNIMGNDSHTSCEYEAHSTDNKWTADLLYRGIDTQLPFLNRNGQDRMTGSNWCETDKTNMVQEIEVDSVDSVDSSQVEGIDIRNVYKDAGAGDYSPVYDFNNNGYLDVLDVAMLQIAIAGYRKVYFNSNFSLDDYWWYTGNTVIAASDWNDHYNDFLDDFDANFWRVNEKVPFDNKDLNVEVYTIDDRVDKLKYDFDNDGSFGISDVTRLQSIAKSIFWSYGVNYELHQGHTIYSALGIKDGDINLDGFVNSDDYSMLEEVLNGNETLNVVQKYYADCDRNGYLNEDDKKCIQDIINPQNIQKSDLDENGVLKNPIEINQEPDLFARIDSDEFTNSCSNSSNNNATVKTYITNRPTSAGTKNSVSTEKTEPLYSFMLTPNIIKKIRDYNKVNQYDDFNLGCSNGYNCISDFVSALYKGTYDDGKIKAANVSGNDKCSDRGKFCEVTG